MAASVTKMTYPINTITKHTTLYPKNIPNIIDCKLKKDYAIFIIFCTNIPDTTGHQMTIQFPTSPTVCFCTTWGKQNQQNIASFLSKAAVLLNQHLLASCVRNIWIKNY